MSKLTKEQREELKHLVLNGIVHHFTISGIQQYVQISIPYIKCLKSELKKDSKKELDYLVKDRFAFIHSIFFERLEELKSYQRTLHNIVLRNPDKPEAQVKAVAQLQSLTTQIAEYYAQLPGLTSPGVNAFSSTTAIVDNGSGSSMETNNNGNSGVLAHICAHLVHFL